MVSVNRVNKGDRLTRTSTDRPSHNSTSIEVVVPHKRCHSAASRPSAHLPIPRSRTQALHGLKEFKESKTTMNHSMYSADRKTHLKIVVVGLLCACFVLIVGVFAHTAQIDLVTAPLAKAGGPSVIAGQLPVIH
jgi:hypothetical protein